MTICSRQPVHIAHSVPVGREIAIQVNTPRIGAQVPRHPFRFALPLIRTKTGQYRNAGVTQQFRSFGEESFQAGNLQLWPGFSGMHGSDERDTALFAPGLHSSEWPPPHSLPEGLHLHQIGVPIG